MHTVTYVGINIALSNIYVYKDNNLGNSIKKYTAFQKVSP